VGVFIVRRLIISFFTLIAASFIVFWGTSISGDPFFDLRRHPGPGQAEQQIAERTRVRGLDTPSLSATSGGSLRCPAGDFGLNIRGQDVSSILGSAAAATMKMVIAATILAIVLRRDDRDHLRPAPVQRLRLLADLRRLPLLLPAGLLGRRHAEAVRGDRVQQLASRSQHLPDR
jgi:hypothetical protein